MVGTEKPCLSPDPDSGVTFTCPSTKLQYHLRLGGLRNGKCKNVQRSQAMLTLSTGMRLNAGYSGSTNGKPVGPHSAFRCTFIRAI